MTTTIVIGLIAGIVCGAVAWLLRGSRADAQVAAATARAEGADRELSLAREQISRLQSEMRALEKTSSANQARLEEAQKAIEAQKAALVEAEGALSKSFQVLANEILEAKSKRFSEESSKSLSELLNPLKEKIATFQATVERVHTEDTRDRGKLDQLLTTLSNLNQQLSEDANNLTRALTGSGKVQGDWGEMILERILEASGLRKDEDYLVQQNIKNAEGENLRPDVLIKLPEAKSLIVDSKTSLTAYNEYASSEDGDVRARALNAHLASVRRHVKELSEKSYDQLQGLKAPDFVIMFIPIDAAFMLAISNDVKLWEDAYRSSILLVNPTTLLFVLRTVAQLWKTEKQRRNVDEIARRGGELYDKFVGFVEEFRSVGESLDRARNSYDGAFKKLSEGKGNLVRQAEVLRELGVKSKKALPADLVDAGDEEGLTIVKKADAAGA